MKLAFDSFNGNKNFITDMLLPPPGLVLARVSERSWAIWQTGEWEGRAYCLTAKNGRQAVAKAWDKFFKMHGLTREDIHAIYESRKQ